MFKKKKYSKKKRFLIFIITFILFALFLFAHIENIASKKRAIFNFINTNILKEYNVSDYRNGLMIGESNISLRDDLKRKNNAYTVKNTVRQVSDFIRGNEYDITEFLNRWEDSIEIPNLGISITGCKSMVPQGICFAKDYILISEYCKCDTHHESLICVLDRSTGEYVKTLILQNEYVHAGGITYDDSINQVVLAGSTFNEESLIYYYNFEDIVNLEDGDYLNINYIKKIPLSETSFISYNKILNELYIGLFSKTPNSGAIYTLDSRKTYENLDAFMQGCYFYDNYIAFSYSYGISNSKIVIKTLNKDGSINNSEEIYSMACPPYLEEIIIDEDAQKMYCLFESGAAAYRTATNLVIDRIVILDISDILEGEAYAGN